MKKSKCSDSTFVYEKKKDNENVKEQFVKNISKDYTRLHFGRVAVQDQDIKKITLMAQFFLTK